MTQSDQLDVKIRTYLSSLSPKALEALVRNLERARAKNSADPNIELVLQSALDILRKPVPKSHDLHAGDLRRGQIQRMFFSPLDGFLIDEFLPTRQEGRINRDMLNKVWKWIGRDLIPNDVRTVLEHAGNAAVSGERIDTLVQALRTRSVDAIGEALRLGEVDEREHRRMGIELGGERGISELRDIRKVFASERWLIPFLQAVPDRINERNLKKDNGVMRLVDKCTTRFPGHVPLLAAAFIDRADTPSGLCSFSGRLAGDDDPKAIASSQFAPFVDVVMSEAERLNILAIDHRNNNPDPVAFSSALSDYNSLVRGIERDMDLSVTDKWHQRLAHTKRSISDVVTRELHNAHSAVRRALQVPKVDSDGNLDINKSAIDDAVRALRVVTMVRNGSDTFAVNDVSKRTRQTVEQTLEIVARSLISDLGKSKSPQLAAHLAAADTAIMLSEIYFGADYAAQLRRSRHAALAKANTQKSSETAAENPERRLINKALKRA